MLGMTSPIAPPDMAGGGGPLQGLLQQTPGQFGNPLLHLGLGLLANRDNPGAGLQQGLASINASRQAGLQQALLAGQLANLEDQRSARQADQQRKMDLTEALEALELDPVASAYAQAGMPEDALGAYQASMETRNAPEGFTWADPSNPGAGAVPIPGYWETKVATARASRPVTNVNVPKEVTRVEGLQSAIQRAQAAGDTETANLLRNEMLFDRLPEGPRKALIALPTAQSALNRVFDRIKAQRSRFSVLDPIERANLEQDVQTLQLAVVDLKNRGANLTENEKAAVEAIVGGNPNDIGQRLIQGNEVYLNRLKLAGEALRREGQQVIDTFTGIPDPGGFQYSWERDGAAPQPGSVPTGGAPGSAVASPANDPLGIR